MFRISYLTFVILMSKTTTVNTITVIIKNVFLSLKNKNIFYYEKMFFCIVSFLLLFLWKGKKNYLLHSSKIKGSIIFTASLTDLLTSAPGNIWYWQRWFWILFTSLKQWCIGKIHQLNILIFDYLFDGKRIFLASFKWKFNGKLMLCFYTSCYAFYFEGVDSS